MYTSHAPSFDDLYTVAESQCGFFNASQARATGYSRQLQAYHASTGEWIRKDRGIFRLKHFPAPPLPDGFYVTYLWALNRENQVEGIFGHGTALYLHQLSTYVPPVLDLIVPKHFRRHSEAPSSIEFHKQTVDRSDYEFISGVPTTKPLKTIVDLLEGETIDHDYILDALETALTRFRITLKQMQEANMTANQRIRLKRALERLKYEGGNEI